MSGAVRFDGRVVIVTGAGRGIGRSYAEALSARGAKVVVNDLGVAADGSEPSGAPADQTVETIQHAGGMAIADHSDIAEEEGAAGLIARALAEWGRIDAVINNAGIFVGTRPFLETSLDEFARVWRVHLGGTYNVCKAVLPHFLTVGAGRILNSCSVQGLYGAATSADYASAKGAVQALTLSLAASVADTGIAVNAISPGGFTRMVRGGVRDAELTAMLEANLPPELVAPVALWLCHPDCTTNGRIFQAYAGRVSETVIGERPGFWDFDLTPEAVAAGMAALTAQTDLMTAPDSAAMVRRVLQEAVRRKS